MLRILFGSILNTFNTRKLPFFHTQSPITCICDLVKMWVNTSDLILSLVQTHFFISFFFKFCIHARTHLSLAPENSDNGYTTA